MPLYVYSCPDCKIVLEELRPIGWAGAPVECPVCHGVCVRDLSTFNTRSTMEPDSVSMRLAGEIQPIHGYTCDCCAPRRRR